MSMTHHHLAFCPYLSVANIIRFADWELGPLRAFQDRWAEERFESQSNLFLSKFVDPEGETIQQPTLLCRRDRQIDGALPEGAECEALQSAISLAFLDENPRRTQTNRHESWKVITADNTDLFVWPIDLEAGWVTVSTGFMVRTLGGGYRLTDPDLLIRPPLDLSFTRGSQSAFAGTLDAVYRTVLGSLRTPGESPHADRLRAAIRWFEKAWRNTATVHFPERLVFLKTGFEALTGTGNSRKSAQALRELFESLPGTTAKDSERLVWSPEEKPLHERVSERKGKRHSELLTDLEQWFMVFAHARNRIVHEGAVPEFDYHAANLAYAGHLVFTAEFLFRAAIKASLEGLGFPHLWREELARVIRVGYPQIVAQTGGS